MKPEAQRIAIAEACGWQQDGPRGNRWIAPDGHIHEIWGSGLACPDYLNDLNAMHEAEKMLTDDQKHEFEERLSHEFYFPTMTTAAQRAEAFLRTLNLWTNDA